MKCPICGSEYDSSEPQCYACGMGKQVIQRADPELRKRNVAVGVSVIVTALGIVVLVFGLSRMAEADSGIDYQGMSVFGALLACLGIGLAIYSMLSAGVSLWNIHKGVMSPTRIPVALLSSGLSLMIFTFAFFAIVGLTDDLSSPEIMNGLTVESIAAVLIVAGTVVHGRKRFRPNEETQPSEGMRHVYGIVVIVLGLAFIIGLTSFGLTSDDAFLTVIMGLLMGVVIVFAGMAIMAGPFPRPWVPGGYK